MEIHTEVNLNLIIVHKLVYVMVLDVTQLFSVTNMKVSYLLMYVYVYVHMYVCMIMMIICINNLGEFKNDQRCGNGTELYANGDSYRYNIMFTTP